MDRIALAVGSDGKLTDFFSITEILFYEKQQEWTVTECYKTTQKWNRESVAKLRLEVEELGNAIIEKNCSILVGKEILGVPYHTLCKMGLEVFEADEISTELLKEIYEDFLMEKVEIIEEMESVLPKPIPVDDEGNYFLDFVKASKCHPELSSKKMLLPFLNNDLFYSIIILAEHVMPWLEEFAKTHNLQLEAKRENGITHMMITHKVCDS